MNWETAAIPVTAFSVASLGDLNTAVAAINVGGTSSAPNTAYTIVLTTDLTLTGDIMAISLATGDTLSIAGQNAGNDNLTANIDGDSAFRGFVVNAGVVSISNLAITSTVAPGGVGSPGGGSALFVAAGATVTTSGVSFSNGHVRGGVPAGGDVFVQQGGSLVVSGGTLAGAGTGAASDGISSSPETTVSCSPAAPTSPA